MAAAISGRRAATTTNDIGASRTAMTTAPRPTTAAAVTVPAATNGEIDRVGCAVVVVNMNARSFVQSWPRRRPQSDACDNSP